MQITFNSIEELRSFVNDFSNNQFYNATFIDNSNGQIKEKIDELYMILSDEYQEIYDSSSDEEKRQIELEQKTHILNNLSFLNLPNLINFIMDKGPNLRSNIDINGNPLILACFSDNYENNKVMITRGFYKLINEQITCNYSLLDDKEIYPIHFLVKLYIDNKTKLDTIKLLKYYGLNLNVTTRNTNETAVLIYVQTFLFSQNNISDEMISILFELCTRENLRISNINSISALDVIYRCNLKNDIKIKISNI